MPIQMKDVPDFSPRGTIPEGDYVSEIVNIEKDTSKAGNAKINLTLRIIEGQCKDREVFDNLVYLESCAWKFKQFFKALMTAEGERIPNIGLITLDEEHGTCYYQSGEPVPTKYIFGARCLVRIVHEEYQGKTRHKVDGYLPLEEDEKDRGSIADQLPDSPSESKPEQANEVPHADEEVTL